MKALGFIETRGLLPAIEGADVMLKAAQVELVGKTIVGGGLVTIVVMGDVGAVKAAVEAGAAAVKKISQFSLVSQHVIARPHDDIESIIVVTENPAKEPAIAVLEQKKASFVAEAQSTVIIQQSVTNQPVEVVESVPESADSMQITLEFLHKEGVDALVQKVGLEKSVNTLTSFSVVKLRNLAREYKELDIAGRVISKANKELLIRKIKEYYERGRGQ